MQLAALRPQSTAQLVKLLLIPILGGVLYSQLGGVANTDDAPTHDPVTTRGSRSADKANVAVRKSVSWPVFQADEIARFNPFAKPTALRDPKEIEAEELAAQQAAVNVAKPQIESADVPQPTERRLIAVDNFQAIYQSNAGAVVLVDNQTYRVNDYLRPGVKIVAIQPTAVLVESDAAIAVELPPSSTN